MAPTALGPSLDSDVQAGCKYQWVAEPDNPYRQHPNFLEALACNQAIPADSFCSRTEAIVPLNTGDALPVAQVTDVEPINDVRD